VDKGERSIPSRKDFGRGSPEIELDSKKHDESFGGGFIRGIQETYTNKRGKSAEKNAHLEGKEKDAE